ncbi:MAG: hypothetical protein ACFFG0_00500 [Candidatus Thorarchaeota archaeon]
MICTDCDNRMRSMYGKNVKIVTPGTTLRLHLNEAEAIEEIPKEENCICELCFKEVPVQ